MVGIFYKRRFFIETFFWDRQAFSEFGDLVNYSNKNQNKDSMNRTREIIERKKTDKQNLRQASQIFY